MTADLQKMNRPSLPDEVALSVTYGLIDDYLGREKQYLNRVAGQSEGRI